MSAPPTGPRLCGLLCTIGLIGAFAYGCTDEENAGQDETLPEVDEATPSAADPQSIQPSSTQPQSQDRADSALAGSALELPQHRRVQLQGAEGARIIGDFYPNAEVDAPLWVFAHQLSSDRHEWEPLISSLLADHAAHILTFDLRGHGESVSTDGGAALNWQSFAPADWQLLAHDMESILRSIRQEPELRQTTRVALIGASIGSSALVASAVADPQVRALVLLSPGRAYRGIDALTPLSNFGDRSLLAIAARQELPSVSTVEDMVRIVSHGRSQWVEGSAHGVSMIAEHQQLSAVISAFLSEGMSANSPEGTALGIATQVLPADPER